MVVRLPHEKDRRATFVRLTPKGARQFTAMAKAHEAWVNEILGNFGDQEIRTMIALLDAPTFKSGRSAATTHQEAGNVW
jgi:DNA-binding MarR family transcriptional regulator